MSRFRDNDKYECKVRLLMIGDSGVGKSALLLRFSSDMFNPNYMATIGIDFRVKTLSLPNFAKPVKVQVWDTAGQERFRVLTRAYFRGADGILLTYDVTDQSSFLNVNYWMKQVYQVAGQGVKVCLVANKCDRHNERVITKQEGKKLADSYKMKYFECSAKEGTGVDKLFDEMSIDTAFLVKERVKQQPLETSVRPIRGGKERSCPGCVII
mmetsp:Transcript_11198/g.27533  ORF Transcript_11198/g.27533 Transcript_11198/m.27533 type:complete len:211 (+) Transcript_11198:329-961(+)|eukprot:CAMPEP_0114493440 /NCGR_PEP_ID=MMETSP0109-20121206/4110_1 /TAXON_ID=29199 /ORGANISM="Chlorarachnion reptans, Strain CCCM449" /LENGTH=210 /DNA_ID=CAMNT_0001670391 /DNA_START=293 /DNA_END=925 /DNA_ORIENTATION=+